MIKAWFKNDGGISSYPPPLPSIPQITRLTSVGAKNMELISVESVVGLGHECGSK